MNDSVVFDSVRVDFQGRDVLTIPELVIPARKLVAIVGPNGGAKTTLLRVLLGEVCFQGQVTQPEFLQDSWAYMEQSATERRKFPLTVGEYISVSLYREYGIVRSFLKKGRKRLRDALESVSLHGFEGRLLKQLSGGEWQRVQLARLLLLGASGYALDEPFSAMDRRVVGIMQERLRSLRDAGKTLLVVTHDLVSVKELFDYVILLRGGVVACGSPKKVLTAANIEQAYGWMVNSAI